MTAMLTGLDVQRLRQALGLSVPHFAQVLGVAHTTAYRWELAGPAGVRIEPMQLGVVLVLQDKLGTKARSQTRDVGRDIEKALRVGGPVFALYRLLDAAFNIGSPDASATTHP